MFEFNKKNMNDRMLRIISLMVRQGVIAEKETSKVSEEAVEIYLQVGGFKGDERTAIQERKIREQELEKSQTDREKKKLLKEIGKLRDIEQKFSFLNQTEVKKKIPESKLTQVPKSQREAILFHLQEVGFITTFEAFVEYGVTRLSARIFDLRQEGFEIEGEELTKTNRFNHTCRYYKYFLVNNEKGGI